jgi:hypothetical protein
MAPNDGERKAGRFKDAIAAALDRLRAPRGPGERYSDVIVRLAKGAGERAFNESEAARRCRGSRPCLE